MNHTTASHTRTPAMAAALLGAVALMTACSSASGGAPAAGSHREAGAHREGAAAHHRQAGYPRASRPPAVRLQDATATALKKVPGIATSADLDSGRAGPVWEYDVLAEDGTWHRVNVGATSGKVVTSRTTTDDDAAADAALAKQATVTLSQAADVAERKVAGRTVSADLDDDFRGQRRPNWDVEVRGDDDRTHELVIDAKSKAVLSQHTDTGD